MLDGSLVRAAASAELLVDPEGASPFGRTDRAVGQSREILPDLGELGRVARAVEQLEADHVARRELAVDQSGVECLP